MNRARITTVVTLLCFQWISCAGKAPLHVGSETRYLKSWFSGFSSRVVENSTLSTDGESLFFGSRAGILYSADGRTGKERWSTELNGSIDSTPLVADQTVYVGTIKGKFYALDKKSGKKKWEYDVVGEVIGKPSLVNQVVIFGTHLGQIYALEASSGKYLWKYKKDAEDRMVIHAFTTPLVQKDHVIVGFSDGTILCLQAQTGDKVWSQTWTDAEKFSDIAWLVPTSEKSILVGKFNGQAAAYNVEDGTQQWTLDGLASAATPILVGEKLISPTVDSKVKAVDPSTGQPTWQYDSGKQLHWNGVSVFKEHILATTFDGSLYQLSSKDGKFEWEYVVSYPIQGAAVPLGDKLWLLTRKGVLISLQP